MSICLKTEQLFDEYVTALRKKNQIKTLYLFRSDIFNRLLLCDIVTLSEKRLLLFQKKNILPSQAKYMGVQLLGWGYISVNLSYQKSVFI